MKPDERPYFLWDYNLTDADVRRILAGPNETDRRWLIGRLLEAARFEDIWKYLKLKDVTNVFAQLKLRSQIKRAWQRALQVWESSV